MTRPTALRSIAAVSARRHEPRLQVQIVLALVFVAAAGAFGHIVEDYLTGDPLVRWDVQFSRWLHEHSSSSLVSLFKVVTLAGNVVVLAVLTALLAGFLVRRRRLDEAALLCFGALGIELLNAGLKLLFHRPRPELAYVHLDTYSFPSGHAAGASAVYGLVLYLLARRAATSRRVVAGAAFVALVAIVGFSRLYLEVHYLSDVLAGTSLGTAWAASFLFLYEVRHDAASRLVPGKLRRRLERA
jgi:undecaprenyl-diphosphatase